MPHSASSSKDRSAADNLASRGYLFVVTSLATFLLGFVLIHALPIYTTAPNTNTVIPDVSGGEPVEIFAKEYDTARADLELIRTQLQRNQESLDSFVKNRVAETTRRLQEVAQNSAALEKQAQTAVTPAEMTNPVWREVSLHLREMTARKSILATRLTSEHPELQKLDIEIGSLQQQLAALPETIPVTAENPKTATEYTSRQLAAIRQTEADLRDRQANNELEQNRLVTAVSAAEQEAERRTYAERVAWQKLQLANNRRLVTEQAEQLQAQHGVSLERGAVLGGAILAIIVGGIVTWLGGGRRQAFQSVEQAQAQLPVPVVGVLSSSHRRDQAQSLSPKFVPLVKALSEITVASALVGFTIASLTDGSILSQFAQDPFACLHHLVEKALFIRR